MVTAGAIYNNWMSSPGSTWLDTTRYRYPANNINQEKELASSDDTIISCFLHFECNFATENIFSKLKMMTRETQLVGIRLGANDHLPMKEDEYEVKFAMKRGLLNWEKIFQY